MEVETLATVATPVTVVTPLELLFVWVAVAMVGRTEGDTLEASMVETAQTEPSPVPLSLSMTGRTEAGASDMSVENLAVGQASMPVSSTSSATG
jgi:hypothetical protein